MKALRGWPRRHQPFCPAKYPMMKTLGALAIMISAGLPFLTFALVATAPNSTTLELRVVKSCLLNGSSAVSGTALGELHFGFVSTLAAAPTDAQTAGGANGISVKCTPGTAIKIFINDGSNALATQRRLKHTSLTSYINYQLYRDPARTQIWNSTTGIEVTLNDDDTHHFPIYGRVAQQTTPSPGTYTDLLTVSVEF